MSQRQESPSFFQVPPRVRRAAAALAVFAFLSGPAARAQSPPLELRKGDRIVLLGNTMAERLQQYNNFETLLMARFPDLDLVVPTSGGAGTRLRCSRARSTSVTRRSICAIRSRTSSSPSSA